MDRADTEACDFPDRAAGRVRRYVEELGEAAVHAAGVHTETKAAKPAKTKGKVAGEVIAAMC